MAKSRKGVPRRIRTSIMLKADRMCCVCDGREPGAQLHHLDNDASNSTESNLVLLCLRHHDEAGKRGGLSAALDRATIVSYRDAWYRRITERRAASHAIQQSDQPRGELAAMVEAVQVAEVRRTRRSCPVPPNWKGVEAAIESVSGYALEHGLHIRLEVLEFADALSVWTRRNMPSSTTRLLASLVTDASLAGPVAAKRGSIAAKAEERLLEYGAYIAFTIVHAGAKYRRDLAIVDAGAVAMWHILRRACLADLRAVEATCKEYYNAAARSADQSRGGAFTDARRWIEFQRDDALAIGDKPMPELPRDVEAKLG